MVCRAGLYLPNDFLAGSLMGRRLLFVGGPLHGQVLPVPDGGEFEAPVEGSPRYVVQRALGDRLQVMSPEGVAANYWEVQLAMRAFFVDAARRVEDLP